jgi:mannose-6-phosphate isomerase
MGTHNNGPASLFSSPSTKLSAVIKSDPEHYLGSAVLKKWPNTQDVPFLFKILSIQKALPLQAHPDKELGAALNKQNSQEFVDANHKPEIAVAIGGTADGLSSNQLGPETEHVAFTGFVGFQPLEQIVLSIEAVPELRAAIADDAVFDTFISSPSKESLKALYSRLLTRGKEQPNAVKAEVEKLVKRVASGGWGEVADEATAVNTKLIVKVNDQYPGDVGVLACPFFMNLVRLKKGESIYIGADEIHAYLEGGEYLRSSTHANPSSLSPVDIIECMAVSDNVVNSAFAPPEERDIKTFTEMLTYTSREPSHWSLKAADFSRSTTGQTKVFSPPLEEFDVLWTQLAAAKPEHIKKANGPTIGIVTGGGDTRFTVGGEEMVVPTGGVVYVVPGHDVAVEQVGGGEGEVWWATYSV